MYNYMFHLTNLIQSQAIADNIHGGNSCNSHKIVKMGIEISILQSHLFRRIVIFYCSLRIAESCQAERWVCVNITRGHVIKCGVQLPFNTKLFVHQNNGMSHIEKKQNICTLWL